MTEEIEDRITIVTDILARYTRPGLHTSYGDTAREIIRSLDKHVLSIKWTSVRDRVLEKVHGCWIPHNDLLDYLNNLPGSHLTIGDLEAKLSDPKEYFSDGDLDEQADSVRVYAREKSAGTDLMATCDVISEEVHWPAWQRRHEEESSKRFESRRRLAQSGKDFGLVPGMDPGSGDRYSRHNGQLYRLIRKAPHQYALFRVHDIGDEGKATTPHIFIKPAQARDAIARGIK